MSKIRQRACDGCRSRKIRCDGQQPCQQCGNVDLQCIYNVDGSSSRSRRAIVRGKVIRSIKHRESPTAQQGETEAQDEQDYVTTQANFVDMVEDYGRCVLPLFPVFNKSDFVAAIENSQSSPGDQALLSALAALTVNMAGHDQSDEDVVKDRVTSFCMQALTLRGPVMPSTSFTASSILISLITSSCLFSVHHDVEMGIYYLRDAISQMQTLNVPDWAEAQGSEDRKKARLERLYWVLFIHERFIALTHFRPAILSPLRSLPRTDDSIPEQVMSGFNQLITLFLSIDSLFLQHWLDKESPTMTVSWIESKQMELSYGADWDIQLKALTDIQQVDLIITRYWLRTLVWQMALSKHFLASTAVGQQQAFSMFFPMHISHHVKLILLNTRREAVEIHGTGLLQKIFDVAAATADILVHVMAPFQDHQHAQLHLENFVVLYRFLLGMSRFYHIEKAILRSKYQSLQALFPSLEDDISMQSSAG